MTGGLYGQHNTGPRPCFTTSPLRWSANATSRPQDREWHYKRLGDTLLSERPDGRKDVHSKLQNGTELRTGYKGCMDPKVHGSGGPEWLATG